MARRTTPVPARAARRQAGTGPPDNSEKRRVRQDNTASHLHEGRLSNATHPTRGADPAARRPVRQVRRRHLRPVDIGAGRRPKTRVRSDDLDSYITRQTREPMARAT